MADLPQSYDRAARALGAQPVGDRHGVQGSPWAVVEANMAWFSHAYAADPARVLDVVLRAAGPHEHLRPRDLAFERH